jgi:hypothetical protein
MALYEYKAAPIASSRARRFAAQAAKTGNTSTQRAYERGRPRCQAAFLFVDYFLFAGPKYPITVHLVGLVPLIVVGFCAASMSK